MNGPAAAFCTAKAWASGEPQTQMMAPSPFSSSGQRWRSGAGTPELRIISWTL